MLGVHLGGINGKELQNRKCSIDLLYIIILKDVLQKESECVTTCVELGFYFHL